MNQLTACLIRHTPAFHSVLPPELQWGPALILDMNADYWHEAIASTELLIAKTAALLAEKKAVLAIGRYAENREYLYRRSPLFNHDTEYRSVHLGIDLTVPAQTPIFSPCDAIVHSFAHHADFGDYGPTLILQHSLEGTEFFTLYGHLSIASLALYTMGKSISRGQLIGFIGDHTENGGWPPHLHFQIIRDLEGFSGTYPGVATVNEAPRFLENCPDPNLILRLLSIADNPVLV